MATIRIALANIAIPASPEESVENAVAAIAEAGRQGAEILCFPECYVPGYRALGRSVPPPDAAFLRRAWDTIATAAAQTRTGVILGTERVTETERPLITALVIAPDGTLAGFQDKVQLDPSEDTIYTAGSERRVFTQGPLTFGIAICHEGFRYPETVRWAARNGAQVVFHPHFDEWGPEMPPARFADPANTFHEKSMLCRAAENSCFFASVNCAAPRSTTTSAIIRPDGTLLCHQPYGRLGLLVADLDLSQATGMLAARYQPPPTA